MSNSLVSKLQDADMQAAPAALLRAAERAREIARHTNTSVVLVRNGKLIEERDSAEPAQVDRVAPGEKLAGAANARP